MDPILLGALLYIKKQYNMEHIPKVESLTCKVTSGILFKMELSGCT